MSSESCSLVLYKYILYSLLAHKRTCCLKSFCGDVSHSYFRVAASSDLVAPNSDDYILSYNFYNSFNKIPIQLIPPEVNENAFEVTV